MAQDERDMTYAERLWPPRGVLPGAEERLARRAILVAWEALCSANSRVIGCASFAPDALRQRDLPRLVEALAAAEWAMGEALEAAGVFDEPTEEVDGD